MRVYRARCVFCAHDGLRVPKAYVQMCVYVSCTNIGWRVCLSRLLAMLVVQLLRPAASWTCRSLRG
jgi:hypothetical protein